MIWDPAVSLRSRIVLIILVGAVLPLALLGFWLTGTAERSGEALLRERLETSLGEVAQDVGLSWLTVRGEILRIAELPEVQAGLRGTGSADEFAPPPIASSSDDDLWAGTPASSALQVLFADLQGSVEEVRNLDAGEGVRWRAPPEMATANAGGASGARPLPIRLGIFDLGSGRRLGTLEVDLSLSALLSGSATWGGVAGSLLAEHLVRRAAKTLHWDPPVLSPDAAAALLGHNWPGNVRELENCLTRAVVVSTGDVIRPSHLAIGPVSVESPAHLTPLDDVERDHVARVLTATGGHKTRSAEILQISRPRLARLIEKFGLE